MPKTSQSKEVVYISVRLIEEEKSKNRKKKTAQQHVKIAYLLSNFKVRAPASGSPQKDTKQY